MDSNLRREIIIDHYEHPINRQKKEDKDFTTATTISDSCIDNITLYVKFNGDVIQEMYFDGEACAITTSATSIMIKMFTGKTITEAYDIMNNYYNMIEEKTYDKEKLGELNAYEEIYMQPNRKKCAIFPFETLKKAIMKHEEEK